MIENEFYRVGYDVREGRHPARSSTRRPAANWSTTDAAAGFGQYVYDRYATAPHFNHLSGHVAATDRTCSALRSIAHRAPSSRGAAHGRGGERLDVRLDGDGRRLAAHDDRAAPRRARLDITNRLAKQATPAKEGVFFAFPFACRAADRRGS